MNDVRSLVRPLAALAVAGLLAGCAGAGSAPVIPPNVSQMQRLADGIEAVCKKDNGVSVNPCSVSLLWSKPKATVTTAGPKGGVFSFNDATCSSKKIATVAGSGKSYTVTWGSASGTCSVVFTDKVKGKTIGTATLSVKNTA
jgi:hypothetical protein